MDDIEKANKLSLKKKDLMKEIVIEHFRDIAIPEEHLDELVKGFLKNENNILTICLMRTALKKGKDLEKKRIDKLLEEKFGKDAIIYE